jgi:pilus assembly protein CpaB
MPRKIVLIVSLVAGISAAMLTKMYIGGKMMALQNLRADFDRKFETDKVLCFKNDVTAGMVLSEEDLGWDYFPTLGMTNQVVMKSESNLVIGKTMRYGHIRGEVLLWSDIEGGNPRDVGLSGDIKRDMRAISINCSGAAAVSGNVRANDHVDVIGTFVFPEKDGTLKQGDIETCTILQNVLVLAIGQSTAKNEVMNRGYSTVTLEVTAKEAEMIAFAEQMKGRLVLTLRNRNDNSAHDLPPVDYEKIKATIGTLNLERKAKMERRR